MSNYTLHHTDENSAFKRVSPEKPHVVEQSPSNHEPEISPMHKSGEAHNFADSTTSREAASPLQEQDLGEWVSTKSQNSYLLGFGDNIDTLRAMIKDTDGYFKCAFAGDSGTGKTCVLRRYLQNVYRDHTPETIGTDFVDKDIESKNGTTKFQFWDVAGQLSFMRMNSQYFQNAIFVIVVFDVNKIQTFQNVEHWVHLAQQKCSKGIKIILLGNKIDVDSSKREVIKQDILSYAGKNNFEYMEVSAATGENINHFFQRLHQMALSILPSEVSVHDSRQAITRETDAIHQQKIHTEASKKGCCGGCTMC